MKNYVKFLRGSEDFINDFFQAIGQYNPISFFAMNT